MLRTVLQSSTRTTTAIQRTVRGQNGRKFVKKLHARRSAEHRQDIGFLALFISHKSDPGAHAYDFAHLLWDYAARWDIIHNKADPLLIVSIRDLGARTGMAICAGNSTYTVTIQHTICGWVARTLVE